MSSIFLGEGGLGKTVGSFGCRAVLFVVPSSCYLSVLDLGRWLVGLELVERVKRVVSRERLR